jgi:hypothetical protein
MSRRLLALALILNLMALVPVPLSACAVLSHLEGQCQCSMPTHCAPVPVTQNRNSGPAISCHCIQTGAPFPNALQNAATPAPAVVATNVALPALANLQAIPTGRIDALSVSHLGPPGGRAGLCVFLI